MTHGDNQLISSWLLNNIFWYYGIESKRNSPSEFNITFITKEANVKRTRSEHLLQMHVFEL